MSIGGMSIDITQGLGFLFTIITALLGWLAKSVAAKNAQATAESKARTALFKLGVIGAALLQKAWSSIGPDLQAAFADGKFDDAERAALEKKVRALLADVTDEATLNEIGTALGLPMAGVVAKIGSWLIQKWTEAHDPNIVTSSPNNFPVTEVTTGGLQGVPEIPGSSLTAQGTGPG